MNFRPLAIYISTFIFLSILVTASLYQSGISREELVNKNIEAAGSREQVAKIRNFSFKAGSKTYLISAAGAMKITEGKQPAITEAILVTDKEVKRNSFGHISQLQGVQKETYQVWAKLASGFFTLKNFKGKLNFQGLKIFGFKKLYVLISKINDLEADFFLKPENYQIERMVLKGFDAQGDKYEVNYDFGPYKSENGLNLPSSWFQSQVGTRGTLYQLSEVDFNLPLAPDFFTKLEINIGQVKLSDGVLNGNIIDFNFQRGLLIINTNWTKQSLQQAGFENKDKLILSVGGLNVELDFYDSRPSREVLKPGAKLMMPNRGQNNYLILLWSREFQSLADKLEILSPLQVRWKKRKEKVKSEM